MTGTKVWFTSTGAYSDYSVEYIFESEEDANAYVAEYEAIEQEEKKARGGYVSSYDGPRVEEGYIYAAGTRPTVTKILEIVWGEGWLKGQTQERVYPAVNFTGKPVAFNADINFPSSDAYLRVWGPDFERVRKTFTERLAAFKVALPGLKEAKARNVRWTEETWAQEKDGE